MKSAQGLNDHSLDPQDVSNEKAKDLIPAVLYKFIQWLTSSERKFDSEVDLPDELLKHRFTKLRERHCPSVKT